MFFNRKKRRIAELERAFGKVKTEGFNFNYISRYHCNKDNSSANQVLSDQTCDDLDFDLFFTFIDRTSSKVGQQCLYQDLRTLTLDLSKTEKREKIIKYLEDNPAKINEFRHLLNTLNSTKAYFLTDIFQKELNEKPKWYFLVPLFSLFSFLSVIFSIFNPSFALLLLLVLPIHAFMHYALKLRVNLIVDSVPQLLTLNYIAKKITKDKNISSFFLDSQKSIQAIDKIKTRLFIFKDENSTLDDFYLVLWFVKEIVKITFLLEPLMSFSASDLVKKYVKEIEDVFSLVGELDIILSIIAIRNEAEVFCLPSINSTFTSIESKKLYHPLVGNPIANSFESAQKSFLLTGSNMSGKTTFIRSIGLNFITGMALNTCYAASFSCPILKIYSAIRISDDISSASSYFLQEVEAMKLIIEESNKDQINLILLDELFKGTNTVERISSAKSILSYLNKPNNFVYVSTHDLELTVLLQNEYELYYFGETISNDEITFDYTLKKGVPVSGNAIKILELKNFPSIIIKESNGLVEEFTKNRS